MSYLDDLLGKQIKKDGVILPQRKTINIIGGGSAVDNPSTGETDLDLSLTSLSSVETLTASGAISVGVVGTILNGSSLAMTLAAGETGQIKWVVNIAATAATVTPSSSSGINTVSIGQYGFVQFVFLSGEWRAINSRFVNLTDDVVELFGTAATWSGFSRAVVCTGTTYTITTPAPPSGTMVIVHNQASGDVTFGGKIMSTGSSWLYTFVAGLGAWYRVALT